MQDAGLSAWFHPTIDIQAPGQSYQKTEGLRSTILPGDLLQCDMGFHYLGLATDQQQHAYVLKARENDAPQGIRDALAQGNRLQDIHLEEIQVERTGNEVLGSALIRALQEGIRRANILAPAGLPRSRRWPHGWLVGSTRRCTRCRRLSAL